MSAQSFEAALARLLVDGEFREAFLLDPLQTLKNQELTEEEIAELAAVDRAGLVMAAHSFERKRLRRSGPQPPIGLQSSTRKPLQSRT